MVMTFSKPQAAREIEARSRARNLRVRVECVEPHTHYQSRSQSRRGVVYDLTKGSKGWSCSCDGWGFTGCCKHLAALERRSEREGWAFGWIHPIPQSEPTPEEVAPSTISAAELRRRLASAKDDVFG